MTIRLAVLLTTLMILGRPGVVLGEDPIQKVTSFHVEGMTCSLCPLAISKSLRSIDGVRNVSVTRAQKRVQIVTDPSVDETTLETAIEAAGPFQARLEPETP